MKLAHALMFGTGLLVFAYLVLKNPEGAQGFVKTGSGAYNSGVKVLQGR